MSAHPKWLRDLMAIAEETLGTGAERKAGVIAAARALGRLIDIPGIPDGAEDAAIDAAIGVAIEAVWKALYSPAAKARRAARKAARKARKTDKGAK